MSKAFFTNIVIKAESESVDLIETLKQFRSGSIEARDAILQAHYRIIYNIARRCAGSSRSRDDVYGDAIQLLVQAVEKAKTNLAHENLTGYIISWVKGGLKASRIRNERSFITPPSTYSTQINKGGLKIHRPENSSQFQAIAKREQPSLEFLEILENIAITDREKEVINLRKQSFNYEEIAEKLNLSPSRVGQVMSDLTERFDLIYV